MDNSKAQIWARLNSLLLILIILVNSYVILLPLVPLAGFYAPDNQVRRQSLSRKIQPGDTSVVSPALQPNSLTIPDMGLEQPILEGRDTYQVLDKGILRWPASSTPDKGGNTVILGHRFTYDQPRAAFYHLDKLDIGSQIGITWNNQKYLYKVVRIEVVASDRTEILVDTSQARLTLFTCTPLLWPRDRLVVSADRIDSNQTGVRP